MAYSKLAMGERFAGAREGLAHEGNAEAALAAHPLAEGWN